MKLNETFTLLKAETWANPGDRGDLIPLVYGDFQSLEVNDTAEERGGMTPAVLIDRVNGVWAVNAAPSHLDRPTLYVEGTKQTDDPAIYAYNADVDYEAKGHRIAAIQLNPAIVSASLNKRLSVRMKGAINLVSGALLTNPILALADAFVNHGDWVITDFDGATGQEALRYADANSLPVHWAFEHERTYKAWLTDLLLHYHADHWLTNAGTLALSIDPGQAIREEQVIAGFDADIHVEGGDSQGEVEWEVDARNLCNHLTLHSQYSWVTGEFGRKDVFTNPPSIGLYNSERKREMRLPGIRTAAHRLWWMSRFFERYAFLPGVVRFPLRTLRYATVTPSQYVHLTWRDGWEHEGRGWTRRLLKVLNTSYVRLTHHPAQMIEGFDTWLSVQQPNYVAMADQSSTAVYLYIDAFESEPYGQPALDTSPPGVAALNPGQTWFYFQWQSPDATTYYVYPEQYPDGSWTMRIDTAQPTTGTPIMTKPEITDRLWRRWQLDIDNTPQVYARLVDVRNALQNRLIGV